MKHTRLSNVRQATYSQRSCTFGAWCLTVLCVGVLVLATPFQSARAGALPDIVNGQPLPSMAPVLEQVTPAVVNIATRAPTRVNPLMEDPFFRRFFDLPDDPAVTQPRSVGSGVIVDADEGLIVTNSHVIEGAAEILVTLNDGRESLATLVGSDPKADIAVIRIDERPLTALVWADSDALRVGDFCLAIGNPFGLGQTVTSGIVSALGRSGLGIEDFEDFIQTDASINPGNSGGALINLRGELIGINTAIVGPSGGNVGIGFAIPSNMAADLLQQLVEFGEVRRGALGIAAQALTPSLAKAFGIKSPFGVVIGRIRKESPADKAGLEVGDVITAIDGRRVRDLRAVRNRIGLVRLGQRLKLAIVRNGQPLELDVEVAELQAMHPLLVGLELVDDQTRRGREFVRVEHVEPGSAADQYGIAAGDLVLSVNRRRVDRVEQVDAIAERYPDEVLLLIQRGQQTQLVHMKR